MNFLPGHKAKGIYVHLECHSDSQRMCQRNSWTCGYKTVITMISETCDWPRNWSPSSEGMWTYKQKGSAYADHMHHTHVRPHAYIPANWGF